MAWTCITPNTMAAIHNDFMFLSDLRRGLIERKILGYERDERDDDLQAATFDKRYLYWRGLSCERIGARAVSSSVADSHLQGRIQADATSGLNCKTLLQNAFSKLGDHEIYRVRHVWQTGESRRYSTVVRERLCQQQNCTADPEDPWLVHSIAREVSEGTTAYVRYDEVDSCDTRRQRAQRATAALLGWAQSGMSPDVSEGTKFNCSICYCTYCTVFDAGIRWVLGSCIRAT